MAGPLAAMIPRLAQMVSGSLGSASAAAGGARGMGGALAAAGDISEIAQGLGSIVNSAKGLLQFAMHGGIAGAAQRAVMGRVSATGRFFHEHLGGEATAAGRTSGAVASLADAAGEASKGLFGMVRGVFKASKAINDWSNSAIQQQARIQSLTGEGSLSLAQLGIDRQIRNINLARATSGSFRRMTRARSDFEEVLQPFRRLAQTLENVGLEAMLRMLTLILYAIRYHPKMDAAITIAEAILDTLEGEVDKDTIGREFFDGVTKAMEKLSPPPVPRG